MKHGIGPLLATTMTLACSGPSSGPNAQEWVLATKVQPLFSDFADDFESGTLLTSDAPVGRWDFGFVGHTSNSIAADAAAAHRGSYGLRVIDGRITSGSSTEAFVRRSYAPSGGDFFVRYWVRITSSNGEGNITTSEMRNGHALHQFMLNVPTDRLTGLWTGTTARPS